MIEWLAIATVGQFFVRTKLLGIPTTVFVRRMLLLYIPAGAFTAFGMPGEGIGLTWWLRPFLVLPVAFGLMVGLGIAFPFCLRVVGLITPALGSLLVLPADFLWWIEAGSKLGREQAAASEQLLESVELQQKQNEVRERAKIGALALESSVITDGKAYTNATIENGVLYGWESGKKVALGEVQDLGSTYRVKGVGGQTLIEFDAKGRHGEELVVRPAERDGDEWRAIVDASPPAEPPGAPKRMGPLLQSAALAAATALSYFVGDAIAPEATGRPTASDLPAAAPADPGGAPAELGEPDQPSGEAPDEELGAPAEELGLAEPRVGPRETPCRPAAYAASRSIEVPGRRGYPISNAFDGTNDTAWGVTDAVPGEEWIEITMPSGSHVARLWLTTGYDKIHQRSGDLFSLNAHLRRFTVTTDAGSQTVDVGHDQRVADVRLGATTRRIRIGIESVWPGERWQDLHVSEIRVYCSR